MSKIQQTQQSHARLNVKANKPAHTQESHLDTRQLVESPETMRAEDVLVAQQTVGNQVVQRTLDKDARRKGLTDEQGNLQKEITSQIQRKRGGGSPLPETIQKEAAKKLGRSFKDVRIHTDESADNLSRTISARAFTIGKDIFFKNGVFSPASSAGRETIIHELTHVVQQGGKSVASGALKLGAPDTAHEKEADRIGKKHAASVGAAPVGAVQRESEEDELQMQSAEEDELQMLPDEDEIKAPGLRNPPAANVVDAPNIPAPAPAPNPLQGPINMPGLREKAPTAAPDDELQMLPDEDETKAPALGTKPPAANVDDAPDDAPNMQEPEPNPLMGPINMPGLKGKAPTAAPDDELQMQPDVNGVIQRKWEQDENGKWRKKDDAPKGSGKKPVVPPLNLSKLKSKAPELPKGLPPVPKAVKSTVKAKTKFASLEEATSTEASEKRQEKLGLMEHDRDHQSKGRLKEEQKAGKMSFLGASVKNKTDQEAAAKDPKQVAKQKWMATLKDPKASKEDIEKAKERLGTFHKDVGKKDFKAAKAERRTSLEEAAKSGDDDAYEKWQAERKKTKGEKAKDFFKSAGKKMGSGLLSAGKWAGGKALGFAKKQVNSGVDHFLGTKSDDKDDDKDDAKPSVNIVNNMGGSGSGGGMSAIMEQYSEVLQENKKLKEELAGLKKS